MKIIHLRNKGMDAFVDDEDFDWINGMGRWQAHFLKGVWYASITKRINGVKKHYLMHRLVLHLGPGEIADHADRNGLNNQKLNLRPCTTQFNNANASKRSDNSSGFKGVYFHKKTQKWAVEVGKKHIGLFSDKESAARAYNLNATERYGDFSVLNTL